MQAPCTVPRWAGWPAGSPALPQVSLGLSPLGEYYCASRLIAQLRDLAGSQNAVLRALDALRGHAGRLWGHRGEGSSGSSSVWSSVRTVRSGASGSDLTVCSLVVLACFTACIGGARAGFFHDPGGEGRPGKRRQNRRSRTFGGPDEGLFRIGMFVALR